MDTKKRLLTLAAALFISLTACEGLPTEPTLGLETGEAALSLAALIHTEVTIDFEDIASNPNGDLIVLETYSKYGFTLSNSLGLERAFSSPEEFIPTFSRILFPFPNGATVLERDDGAAFDVVSIGIGEVPLPPFFGVLPLTITFTGTKAGEASSVTQTFTTDGTLGLQPQTFSVTGDNAFTNLESLSWVQAAPFHVFDNIVLSFDDSDPSDPATRDDCKKGGFGFADFGFRNQGQCVRFVEKNENAKDKR